MAGKRIGFNSTVTSGMAKDVSDTKQLSTEARERYATGTNETKRYTTNKKPKGPFGNRGMGN